MVQSGNVAGAFEGVRRQTVGVLDGLIPKVREFELPDPPAALGRYRQKLDRGHDIEGGYLIGPRRQSDRNENALGADQLGRDGTEK